MRLRLEVLRHGLPPVKVLWTTTPESTASQLLDGIDDVFPLEVEGWGFEDYALLSGDYEILHWMQVGQLLSDGDQVTIKPLQTNDMRARRLSGRHQITPDGRHLVDGVAFGRPLLRRPVRPEIYIPPRKRVRLTEPDDQEDDDDDADAHFEDGMGVLGDHMVEPRDDYDDEEQLQIEDAHSSEADDASAARIERAAEAIYQRMNPTESPRNKERRSKRVSFATASAQPDQEDDDNDEEDEEDEEDDDFEGASEGDDDEDTETDVSEDEDLDDDNAQIPMPASPSARAGAAKSKSDTNDSSTSDDDDSDSDDSSSDESSSSSEESDGPSPPFQGKNATRRRNQRRRQSKQLAYLKSEGILPQDATHMHLREWEKANGKVPQSKQATPTDQPTKLNKVQQRAAASQTSSDSDTDDSDSDSSSGSATSSSDEGEDLSLPELRAQPQKQAKQPSSQANDPAVDFETRRNALLAALANGGVDVASPFSASASASSASRPTEVAMTDAAADADASASASTPKPSRLRLDVAASHRLLYGSLGVRTPKSEADKQKLRASLAAQAKRKPVIPPTAAPPTENARPSASQTEVEGDNQDPNLWRKKINLSAVECVFENVEYTRPPFPFRQRWDPQMREKKRKRTSDVYAARKDRKAQGQVNGHGESYDVETGDALNYDDDEVYVDESHHDYQGQEDYGQDGQYEDTGPGDESLAAEAQLLQETLTRPPQYSNQNSGTEEDNVDTDDLPHAPEDLISLPSLTSDNALPGAIVTFTRLEVSAATKWAPATAPIRVAQILAVHDDAGGKVLELQLSKRDTPKKLYDHQGRRIFSGFEMALDDDDEDGYDADGAEGEGRNREGVVEVELQEILEGRIVVEAPAAEADSEKTGALGDGLGKGVVEVGEQEHTQQAEKDGVADVLAAPVEEVAAGED